jgi:Stress responsive A/B Barrel Domain
MIRHVAVFSWKPETTAEQKRQVAAEIAALPPLMSGLRDYRFGPDAGLVAGNAEFAIVADFDDAAAYLRYREHPTHVDVLSRVVAPIVGSRMSVQYEI